MANRFFVGSGTRTWNASNTSMWSATDGGGGGASAPTDNDDVFANGNSGGGTLSIAAGAACKSFDSNGYTGTIAGAGALTVSDGGWRFGAGLAGITYTGALTFASTTGTLWSIICNGKTFGSTINFSGAGGSWQLGDAFLSSASVTVTSGTFNDNGQTAQSSKFIAIGAVARVVTSSGAWTVTGNGNVWDMTTTTGLTFTHTGTIIVANTSASNATIQSGGLTFNDIKMLGSGTGTFIIAGNGTFRDWLIQNTAGANFQCTATINARTVDFTGFVGTWLSSGQWSLTGDLKLAAGMTVTASGNVFFVGSGTQTITSNAVAAGSIIVRLTGTTLNLADKLVTTGAFQLVQGTFNTQNKDLTCASIDLTHSGTAVRAFNSGSSLITLTSTGTVFTVNGTTTNLTWSEGTSTIYVTSTGSTTIAGGNLPFYKLRLAGGGGGSFAMNDGRTIQAFEVDAGPYTVKIAHGTTTTLATGGLTMTGSAGNLITFTSDLGGSQATLSVPANDVICDYLSVQDIVGTGGARFFMGRHSADAGNTQGLRFTDQYRSPVQLWSGFDTA